MHEQLEELKRIDRQILDHKGSPLQEKFFKDKTDLMFELKRRYGVFPTWTPYGYTIEVPDQPAGA